MSFEDTFPDDHLDYNAGALRQALWDVYAALGFDTDADLTPAPVKNLRKLVLDAAKEFRKDYDQALTEIPRGWTAVEQSHHELSKRYGLMPTLLLAYTPDEIRRMEGL